MLKNIAITDLNSDKKIQNKKAGEYCLLLFLISEK